ncbi:MAG: reverse transcriptase domain-containing protein [Planctomycetaceae bacterium]
MKRIGQLWEPMTSFENLLLAYRKARRSKRGRPSVERFTFGLEIELARLRHELLAGEYRPGTFHSFEVHDGKRRMISAAPFRDRVVHHAFCNVVEPVFESVFISDSYACRRGRGTHQAISRYQAGAQRNRFALKCDIAKYFPSIDHAVLKAELRRKIKDPQVLALADRLIDHVDPNTTVNLPPVLFPGDNLFTALERPRGLPLGNQTSQFFSNVMLNPLDHFVKQELGCRDYVRYADDFVLLHDDSRQLGEWRDALEEFLRSRRLRLHLRKRQISRVKDGLPFLGFRCWPTHLKLSNSGRRRFIRRLHEYQRDFANGQLSAAKLTQRIAACIGHVGHAATWGLRKQLFGETVFGSGSLAETSCSSGRVVE